jgi:hypothetical protein
MPGRPPTTSEMRIAIESLRRDIHSFLEIAPKAQDTLRIMFPPEVLITFACRQLISSHQNISDIMYAQSLTYFLDTLLPSTVMFSKTFLLDPSLFWVSKNHMLLFLRMLFFAPMVTPFERKVEIAVSRCEIFGMLCRILVASFLLQITRF